MSNYPDDIRNYNNDPRSPFYEEPNEPLCEECCHEESNCICKPTEEEE